MSELVLPNFLCIGAQKAGTTVLHDILKPHPDIYLAEHKEAPFFTRSAHAKRGLEWWSKTFFHRYKGQKIIGTLTPEYLFDPATPKAIHETFGPDVKLIGILRHPVDRAYSHYLMSLSRGDEELGFSEAIEKEEERLKGDEFDIETFSYISRGRYAEQVQRYVDLFPKENLLWLSYENDLSKQPEQTIARVQEFLGVEVLPLNTKIQSNVATEVRSKRLRNIARRGPLRAIVRRLLPEKLRGKLRRKLIELNSRELPKESRRLDTALRSELYLRFFKDEPAALKPLTGIDFSYWNPDNSTR